MILAINQVELKYAKFLPGSLLKTFPVHPGKFILTKASKSVWLKSQKPAHEAHCYWRCVTLYCDIFLSVWAIIGRPGMGVLWPAVFRNIQSSPRFARCTCCQRSTGCVIDWWFCLALLRTKLNVVQIMCQVMGGHSYKTVPWFMLCVYFCCTTQITDGTQQESPNVSGEVRVC